MKVTLIGGPEDGKEVEMQPWNNAITLTVAGMVNPPVVKGIPDSPRFTMSTYAQDPWQPNKYVYAGEVERPKRPSSNRTRKFAFLPKEVFSSENYRDGFRWLTWVYLDGDGRYYTTEGVQVKGGAFPDVVPVPNPVAGLPAVEHDDLIANWPAHKARFFPEIQEPDPIDADETNYGVCAQGESDDQ